MSVGRRLNCAPDVRLRRTAAVVLAIGWGVTAIAQGPTAKESVFDAVSIKPTLPGTKSIMWTPYPNRLEFLNLTLDQIIVHALRVSAIPLTGAAVSHGRVLGMPKWATEERFDIVGTTREQHAPAELLDMLRRALEERFSLKWHTETKPIPVFALVRMDAERLGAGPAAIDKDCTHDFVTRTSPCKAQFRSDGKRLAKHAGLRYST